MRGTQTFRTLSHDGAGNLLSDSQLGSARAFTYNAANRMKTASFEGNLRGTYTYNGLHQLIKRVVTNTPLDNGTAYYLHDRSGNVIAELDQTGTTAREYIWLPEAGYAGTDMPLAVVDGVNTASPQLYYVHTDHINRPIRMSTTAKVMVWQAEWNPWGGVQSLTGSLAQNLRFPGQWFQIETGLHYNWHRHYDPTIGRYTQPDPLGLSAGRSLYAYAQSNPQAEADPTGENPIALLCLRYPRLCGEVLACIKNPKACKPKFCSVGSALYKPLCSVPGCKPGDHAATLEFKLAAAEACFVLRTAVARFCYGGIDDAHGPPIHEAMEKIAACRAQCISKGN